MQQELKQVYRYGTGFLALASCFLLVTFLLYPYPKLQLLFQQFNAEKETLFPWNDFTGRYGFSEKVYWLALTAYAALAAGSLFLYFRLRKRYGISLKNSLVQGCTSFYRKFTAVWRRMPVWEKWLVFFTWLLLLAVKLYFLLNSRIGQDEAASYIFFISKGLPGIIMYYPLPNNHIFYNLLCLPLSYIFKDPLWTLELPTFFLSIIGSVFVYLTFRSVLPFLVIYFAATIFYFSQYALFFSVHGRGYFLISICAAIIALAIYKFYQGKEHFYWLVFLLFSIIGFYTIPVFLYPFAATAFFGMLAFGFSKNWLAFKQLIIAAVFISFISLLLYSPALLASGELLFRNRYVNPKPFADFYAGFPFFFTYTQGSVVGQETVGFYFWLLGFAGISLGLLFRKRLNGYVRQTGLSFGFLFLVWCNQVFPWLLIFMQRVRPPERVLFYKGFFDLLAIGIGFYLVGFHLFKRWPKILIAGFLVFIAGYSAYQIRKAKKNNETEILNDAFDARLQSIIASGARIIFANEIYYSGNLRYEYFKHRPEGFVLNEYLYNPAYKYDAVILDRKSETPAQFPVGNYELYYQDKFVQIFFAKALLSEKQKANSPTLTR